MEWFFLISEVKDVFFAVGNDGVAGVVATLAPGYDVGRLGEVVNDFAFSFVSPLESADDGVHRMVISD